MVQRIIGACLSLAIIFIVFSTYALHAEELDGSAAILLSGKLANGVGGRTTVKELEALGVSQVEVFDPFEKKTNSYTGIMMESFAAHYGSAAIHEIIFVGIDDYSVSFSKTDWTSHRIMVVTRVNNKYMGYEHKGPLRIIYPEYDAKIHSSRDILPKWIWMITAIKFR
jgi:hypothetical protein